VITENHTCGAHCDACGADVTVTGADWCPLCGAALDAADGTGWDLGASAPHVGRGTDDDTSELQAGQDESASRVVPEKSRRKWFLLACVTVVVLAAAAVGGFFAIRGAERTVALFPASWIDSAGQEKLAFIDRFGSVIIQSGTFTSNGESRFSEGLAPVTVNGKVGFIDTKGRMVIQPRFDATSEFSEGRALVWIDGGCAYIDKAGVYVVPPGVYPEEFEFSEGLAGVEVDEAGATLWGFIDRSGAVVIRPQFQNVGSFSEGLAAAQTSNGGKGGWGYIDKTGRWVIQPQFYSADSFSQGLAAAAVSLDRVEGAQWGFIDKSGAWVVSPHFGAAGRFSEGLAWATEAAQDTWGHTGFIDRAGKWVIPPEYTVTGGFSQGLAGAVPATGAKAGLFGYLDHDGRWVIQPQFELATDFLPQGLARVFPHDPSHPPVLQGRGPYYVEWAQTGMTYIDRTGQVVWQPPGNSATRTGSASTDVVPTTTATTTTTQPPSSDFLSPPTTVIIEPAPRTPSTVTEPMPTTPSTVTEPMPTPLPD
jgi:hypothetical protein